MLVNNLKKGVGILLGLAMMTCQGQDTEEVIFHPSVWKLVVTPTEASLRGLSAPSAEVVWACGSGGVWLRSLDGGKHWDMGIIDGLDSVEFRSIQAFDKDRAIAVTSGQPARIYQTVDGGAHWKMTLEESDQAFFDGISFVDDAHGYVFGDPVAGVWMIYETQNGGSDWAVLDSLPVAQEGEAGFAASASSLIAVGDYLWLGSGGSFSHVYFSPDRGLSWSRYPSPLVQGESSQGIFSMVALGSEHILVVGGDYLQEDSQEGNLGIFNVADKQWEPTGSYPPDGYRSGVAYDSGAKYLITVGPSGTDISWDGGKTWEFFSEEGFHAVSLSRDLRRMWASGSSGKIGYLIE